MKKNIKRRNFTNQKICKLQKRKFYLANNLKLAKKLNLDGVYIPSFNKNPCQFIIRIKLFLFLVQLII